MDGVFAAMTGEGHASDGVCGCGCGCGCGGGGGRACWIAGEACADTCWLIGGDVDVPAAAADVDGVGTDAPSSSGPLSLLRFCARVDVAFSPNAVALIRIWCLAAVVEQNPSYTKRQLTSSGSAPTPVPPCPSRCFLLRSCSPLQVPSAVLALRRSMRPGSLRCSSCPVAALATPAGALSLLWALQKI